MNRNLLVGVLLGAVIGTSVAFFIGADEPKDADAPVDVTGHGTDTDTDMDTARAARPVLDGRAAAYIGRLEERVDANDAEIAALKLALREARRPAAAPAPAAATKPRPHKRRPSAYSKAKAEELGVSDAALEAAWLAREGCYQASEEAREVLIVPLRAFGAEGLRALVALMLGRQGHVVIPSIVEALGVDGGDEILLEAVSQQDSGAAIGGLLESMGRYDTPRVRRYLVDRIADEEDAGNFWNAAAALGRLEEPKGAEAIRVEQFTRPEWEGVRPYILHHIGEMGGPAATRLLTDYLRLAHADHVGAALRALHGIDEKQAQVEARALKRGERYDFLHWADRREVDKYASDE